MIAAFISPKDSRWKAFLGKVTHDIYHLPEYVSLAAKHEGGEAAAFYCETRGEGILIPLLIRKLPSCLQPPFDWRDAATPYGYGSPLWYPRDNTSVLHNFLDVFQAAADERSIVTAFTRFHPLIGLPVNEFKRYCEIVKHGQSVYIDLSLSDHEIWGNTRKNHRKDITDLNRKGFRIAFDEWGQLPNFIRMYHEAMMRLGARSFYFFPHVYFRDLKRSLKGHIHLCSVLSLKGELCSAGLITNINGIVELHLNATAGKYVALSPSKLIFNFVREWAKSQGNKFFHLGGGVGGQYDSLFRFKIGFSKMTSDYFTGRFVFNQERYEFLNQQWDKFFQKNDELNDCFFPLYRRSALPGNVSILDVKSEERCVCNH